MILVPLDASKTAEMALLPAAEMARALGDDLLLMVVVDPVVSDQLRSFAEAEHIDLLNAARTYADRVARSLPAVQVATMAIPGDNPAIAILEEVERRHPRMVAMATHGRTGFDRWWLGSVTVKVVQACTVPVLVVPARNTE